MRVAVISNRNRPGYLDENLEDHLVWIDRAASTGARMVLFPELSLSGYSYQPFIKEMGIKLNDWRCKEIESKARSKKVFVAYGLPLVSRNKLYISHVLTGPKGLIGHYEKVHLAGPVYGEGRVFKPGRLFKSFEVEGVGVGINICFDGRHPGSSLSVAHLGAEVILHPHGNLVGTLGKSPTDWTNNKHAYLGPRSADTSCYTLICNSVGNVTDIEGKSWRYSGGAVVLGPNGEIVDQSRNTSRRPHMVVSDLDIGGLRVLRENGWFPQRRPEVYVEALKS